MTTPKPGDGLSLVRPDVGGWISGPSLAVGFLEGVPCEGGAVDLRDRRRPDEALHLRADEFAAFVSQVKAGLYDYLLPG